MTSSTLALETPSSLARSAANASIAWSRCALRSSRTSFSASRSLAWLTPRSLASASSFSSRKPRRSAPGRRGRDRRAGPERLQRVAQLGLGHAELARRGRRGRAGRRSLCTSSSAERTLASETPSLVASCSAKASRMSPRWPSRRSLRPPWRSCMRLSSAASTLASEIPSSWARAFSNASRSSSTLSLRSSRRFFSAASSWSWETPSCLAASARASRGPPRKPRWPGPAPKP